MLKSGKAITMPNAMSRVGFMYFFIDFPWFLFPLGLRSLSFDPASL